MTLLVTALHAQSPYPATSTPQDGWGGHALPQPVPYQPTLAEPVSTPGGTSWQSYPTADAAADSSPWPQGGPVLQETYPPPGSLACDPALVQPDTAWPAVAAEENPKSLLPPGTRNGVFQKIKFTGAYLPQLENDSLGFSDLQIEVVFGLPFFTRETPIVITPTYAVHYLDGPVTPDMPPRVHDAAVTFQHFRRLGESWIVNGDVTIGEFADDYSFDAADAFRITGSGVVVYEASPVWKWVLGAAYVDRANTTILPIAGAVYKPSDDVEYRLVFPAPKISWRLPWTDVPGLDERWFYVGGEFGGGVWAVQRASGATDQLDVTDWRVFMGLERKIVGGLSRRIELGYVFAREFEYKSTGIETALDDTLMLRVGLTY